jgi:hypothetical protein
MARAINGEVTMRANGAYIARGNAPAGVTAAVIT